MSIKILIDGKQAGGNSDQFKGRLEQAVRDFVARLKSVGVSLTAANLNMEGRSVELLGRVQPTAAATVGLPPMMHSPTPMPIPEPSAPSPEEGLVEEEAEVASEDEGEEPKKGRNRRR